VIEDVVSHLVALFDARVGIKLPMHAHKNAALRIVEFCLAKRFEGHRTKWPKIAVNISILAVVFVRNKYELGVVRPEFAHDLEECAAKCRVARWISREGRGEVRAMRIRRLGTERIPVCISQRRWIPIRITSANAGDWPPVLVGIFRVPSRNARVRHRDIYEREEPGYINDIGHFLLQHDGSCDLVIKSRWSAQ
jgi:hypothetical protein